MSVGNQDRCLISKTVIVCGIVECSPTTGNSLLHSQLCQLLEKSYLSKTEYSSSGVNNNDDDDNDDGNDGDTEANVTIRQ